MRQAQRSEKSANSRGATMMLSSELDEGHSKAALTDTYTGCASRLYVTLRQTYRREYPTVQYAFDFLVLNVFAIRTS